MIRFYIEARDKDRDWTYMEKTRQLCSDGYRRVKDEAVELYEQCVDYLYGEEHEGSEHRTLLSSDNKQQGSPQESSWFSSTLRRTLSPLVTTFSAASPSGSSASSLGRRYEPGTFSTGQVHGEMKYDTETRKWEYRKLYVDIPKSGTIGARRVWIVKRSGEVKR